MDVLFLSISMGAGHLKAAEALNEYVLQKYPHSRSLVVDTFKYMNPLAHKVFVDGYLSTIRSVPSVYGILYRLSEQLENVNRLSKAVSRLFSYKLEKLISEFKPSIIVCTHPFPLQMVSYLKKEKRINTPSVAILTDFVNHPFWFHDNIEAYIVAHENIKMDMVKTGTPDSKVYPYGIPVSKVFLTKSSRNELLGKFDMENKPTVLMMGGSLGFGDIKKISISLIKSRKDLQLIVVTGKNKKLKQQLESYLGQYNKKVKIIGYTNEISELMDISDIIITKPGGMTISEALLKSLPIFIMSPIPGQEERNAHFLINSGAAQRIKKDDNVENLIYQAIFNPFRLKDMKKRSKNLSKPDSGYKTVLLMERLIKEVNCN